MVLSKSTKQVLEQLLNETQHSKHGTKMYSFPVGSYKLLESAVELIKIAEREVAVHEWISKDTESSAALDKNCKIVYLRD